MSNHQKVQEQHLITAQWERGWVMPNRAQLLPTSQSRRSSTAALERRLISFSERLTTNAWRQRVIVLCRKALEEPIEWELWRLYQLEGMEVCTIHRQHQKRSGLFHRQLLMVLTSTPARIPYEAKKASASTSQEKWFMISKTSLAWLTQPNAGRTWDPPAPKGSSSLASRTAAIKIKVTELVMAINPRFSCRAHRTTTSIYGYDHPRNAAEALSNLWSMPIRQRCSTGAMCPATDEQSDYEKWIV